MKTVLNVTGTDLGLNENANVRVINVRCDLSLANAIGALQSYRRLTDPEMLDDFMSLVIAEQQNYKNQRIKYHHAKYSAYKGKHDVEYLVMEALKSDHRDFLIAVNLEGNALKALRKFAGNEELHIVNANEIK